MYAPTLCNVPASGEDNNSPAVIAWTKRAKVCRVIATRKNMGASLTTAATVCVVDGVSVVRRRNRWECEVNADLTFRGAVPSNR
ncbi:hypothetical protein Pth03_79090 [Planotetraspora thailandica]|uniref:Uncharacterized protein n=1 Tax=Planotetraspora thailandica TaxID=487172 RepID=A0A8J4DFV0_9ACTN|nr:hypothetical protein Pth03_79090 [Planotetraspora thailandica]